MPNLYPIDPKKPVMRWGPVPGRLFLLSEFLEVCFEAFPKAFPDFRIPTAVFLFREGSCLWLNQLGDLQASGRHMFQEWILPEDRRRVLYAEWKKLLPEVLAMNADIQSKDLTSLSDKAFEDLWRVFFDLSIRFFTPTLLPEFGNYGSDALLENTLEPFVKDKTERGKVLEALTAPEVLSFYQEEEIELEKTEDIEAHTRRYFWLKNSYAGVQVLPVSFFLERKQALTPHIEERQNNRLREICQRKQKVVDQYHLPMRVVEMANALREAIEWQDERKSYIFQMLHTKDLLLRHAAERYVYDYATLLNYRQSEIAEFVFSRTKKEDYKDRNQGCAVIDILKEDKTYDRFMQTMSKEEIQALWTYYTTEVVESSMTEFGGTVACVGNGGIIHGRVNILLDPTELEGFRAGDVLVAPMTSPEYVFAMKMASAILTDTGGLTSHAAIVSRELHVPCLVGTKVATHLLQTGDEVEVDASKGRVRIVRRAKVE